MLCLKCCNLCVAKWYQVTQQYLTNDCSAVHTSQESDLPSRHNLPLFTLLLINTIDLVPKLPDILSYLRDYFNNIYPIKTSTDVTTVSLKLYK